MRNYEVFTRDPRTFDIPNEGVSKVGCPTTEGEWDVLRFELETFVCEGQYAAGLERILESFVGNLDKPEQPAVWVSGFYGSGKSHLMRVLEALWRNWCLPNGLYAREIVHQTPAIKDALRELSQAGQVNGGLWSAAGSLGSTAGSLRLGLLSIVLRSAGLPESYPLASFSIWLRQEGYRERVGEYLASKNRFLEHELRNLYVSQTLAEALLAAGAGLGDTPASVLAALRAQFPPDGQEVSQEQMLAMLDAVLELQADKPGKLPLTLIVLDEVQQHVQDDPDRILQLQNVVQACTSRFGSRLLFVGTGQAALQSGAQLSKLRDRFRIKIELGDRDVHQVIRSVVLDKRPEHRALLQATLDQVRGEIDKHLVGTGAAPRPSDADDLVPDYTILPTRLRFWEVALRQLDVSGTAGQLRTQLRIIQEANKSVAEQELGVVVPADFIYDQSGQGLVTSGAILRETYDSISALDDGTPLGKLKARVCATVFLVNKLPTSGPNALHLKATAATLGDLLCSDLRNGDAALRSQLPIVLEQLVNQGRLMEIDGEYRLQSREASAWEADFRERYARIRDDVARIASERDQQLRLLVQEALKPIKLLQGDTKTKREYTLHWGDSEPEKDALAVWVRDEWQTTETVVREAALTAGADSPVVHLFVPRASGDDLRDALAARAAAQEVLDARGMPGTPEGIEARRAMESRRALHDGKVVASIDNLLQQARVYQGGGSSPDVKDTVPAVRAALEASLKRLYPRFKLADDPNWSKVLIRIKEGSGSPLDALGYAGDAHEHPVCKEIAKFLANTAMQGRKVRSHFGGAPYGWPQDAVDGALLALVAEGRVSASEHGTVVTAQQIEQSSIGVHTFRNEDVIITVPMRLDLRQLLSDLGVSFTPGAELGAIDALITTLRQRARAAGGPPPLPETPATPLLDEIEGLAGNRRLQAVYEQRDALRADNDAWLQAAQLIKERMPVWHEVQRLQAHAAQLPAAADARAQLQAVEAQRLLLAQPDPVWPLHLALHDAVRQALADRQVAYRVRYAAAWQALQADATWQATPADEQARLLDEAGVTPPPDVTPDSTAALLAALDERPLSWWENAALALDARFEQARLAALQAQQPAAVPLTPPAAVLHNVAELDAYLATLRAAIIRHLDDGHTVII